MLETCSNCERTIGHLETPHLFADKVVCAECRRRLSDESAQVLPVTEAPPLPVVVRTGSICPHCRRDGVYAARGLQGAGEIIVGALLMFTLIGGVIYYAAVDGTPYCPHCRLRV